MLAAGLSADAYPPVYAIGRGSKIHRRALLTPKRTLCGRRVREHATVKGEILAVNVCKVCWRNLQEL